MRQRYEIPQQIKIHQPILRLQRRIKFKAILAQLQKNQKNTRIDEFAMFDAVAKRGGFQAVQSKNRWDQIAYSLIYQHQGKSITNIYASQLLFFQLALKKKTGWYGKTYNNPFVEIHLLPGSSMCSGYYRLHSKQQLFSKQNFEFMDQYLNIKTIALYQTNFNKVPKIYRARLFLVRKWLYIDGQLQNLTNKQKQLMFAQKNDYCIGVIGMNMSTLMIANRLAQFGLKVLIIKQKRMKKIVNEMIVQNGVCLIEGGTNMMCHYQWLLKNDVNMQQISNQSVLLNEMGDIQSQQKSQIGQRTFIQMIQEIQIQRHKNQQKIFYNQIFKKIFQKRTIEQKNILKWHYQRYMLLTPIRGDQTTIQDLFLYQAKRTPRNIVIRQKLVSFKIDGLVNKIKSNQSIIILQHYNGLKKLGDNWIIQSEGRQIVLKHIVFGDIDSLYLKYYSYYENDLCLSLRKFALNILNVGRYLNILFKFKTKAMLKPQLGTNFTIPSASGFIFCFVLNEGRQILCMLKCLITTQTNYVKQIITNIEAKCLLKNNINQSEYTVSFQSLFTTNQNIQNLTDQLFTNEQISVMVPVISTELPTKISAQIQLVKYICKKIIQNAIAIRQLTNEQINIIMNNDNENNNNKLQFGQNLIKKHHNLLIVNDVKLQDNKMDIQYNSQINIIKLTDKNIQINNQCFQFNHPYIVEHQHNIISFFLDKKQDIVSNIICNLNIPFSLTKLSKFVYLHSIGAPFLRRVQWFQKVYSQKNEQSIFFALNNMITRRIGHCLIGSYLTIYYQIVLFVNQKPYYCIIDELFPQCFFFHSNLQTLINKFGDTIIDSQVNFQEQIPTQLPADKLSPIKIINQIQIQLSYIQSQNISEDQLLNQKYQKFIPNKNQKSSILFKPFIQDSDLNQWTNKLSRASFIQQQMKRYLQNIFSFLQMKVFTLGQVFSGILTKQIMISQIMKIQSNKPIQWKFIEQNDMKFAQQLKDESKFPVNNQIYQIYQTILSDSIVIFRNFMHKIRKNLYLTYIIHKEINRNNPKCIVKLSLQVNSKKIAYSSYDDIVHYIITDLLDRYSNHQIVKYFKQMVIYDLIKIKKFGPKLKSYFKITRKKIYREPSMESIQKFKQKCFNLDQRKKDVLIDLMRKDKLKWINNQFVFL